MKLRIVLSGGSTTFYSGSRVSGNLLFDVTKPKKFKSISVQLVGEASVKWEEKAKCFNEYKETENLVTSTVTVWTKESSVDGKLEPGAYSWPFSFSIPDSATSSFVGSVGNIRYFLKGRARSGGIVSLMGDRFVTHDITVKQVITYDDEYLLRPATNEVQKTVCCWPCSSGTVLLTVTMPKRSYVSGESFTMHASLENRSTRRIKLRAQLRKTTSYRAQNHSRHDKCTLLSLLSDPIPPHTTREWTPSDGIPSDNVVNCHLIKHRYNFFVSALIFGARDLNTNIPIEVGFARPRSHYNIFQETSTPNVPLTSRPVIHPSNEPGTTFFHPAASNPLSIMSQPMVIPSAPLPVPSAPLPQCAPDDQLLMTSSAYDPPPPYSELTLVSSGAGSDYPPPT